MTCVHLHVFSFNHPRWLAYSSIGSCRTHVYLKAIIGVRPLMLSPRQATSSHFRPLIGVRPLQAKAGIGTSPSHGGSIHGTGAATPSWRACRTSFAKPIGSHMRRGGVYHAGCGFSKRGHGQLLGGLAPGGRRAGTSIFEPCCDMYMYDVYIHTTICILIYIHIHMYTLSLPLPLPLYVRFMITKPLNAVGTRPPPPPPQAPRRAPPHRGPWGAH